MKTKIKFSILLLIVITSLLFYSCNTENEGVFVRISNSQVKVEVGYVDIIGANTSDIFAYTSEKGFQKFNIASKNWTDIDTTVSYPGLYSSDDATTTTTLYYAGSAAVGEANDLYTYPIVGSESGPDSTYEIVEMKQDNLMLVKNGTGFDVLTDIEISPTVSFSTEFSPSSPPRLIAQGNTNYVISGIKKDTSSTYVHYYLNSTSELTSSDATFDDNPMVAMMSDGTNIVLVSSVGKVWHGTNASLNDFTSSGTIPGWPERNPADLEYPTFIFAAPTSESELYLQNENNDFYKINSAGDISSELDSGFTDFLSGIRIKSYLEAGSTIYAGTMENGIVQITMTGSGTGSAVIL
jgi:hypothetical protein